MEDLFYEVFEDLPRQGPGDRESTKRAFEMLADIPQNPDILDVGCGAGKQTLDLAGLTSGTITAVDNHAPFLATLRKRAEIESYRADIRTVLGNMAAMDFPPESFDLIWSEGASFIIGFANALRQWRSLLRPSGSMAISDMVWLKQDPPAPVRDWLAAQNADMKYYEEYFPVIDAAGYRRIGYFSLPGQSWWADFYLPMERKLAEMRVKYRGRADAKTLLDSFQLEIEMHRQYAEFYGYGFFLMQKTG